MNVKTQIIFKDKIIGNKTSKTHSYMSYDIPINS